MPTLPLILTIGAVEWPHVLALLSLLVGLLALLVTVFKHLDSRAHKAQEDRDSERHDTLVQKIGSVDTRVTETKRVVEDFRGEVAVEIAALHRRDAELALDLERRVAPIEGRLGIGRAAEPPQQGGE